MFCRGIRTSAGETGGTGVFLNISTIAKNPVVEMLGNPPVPPAGIRLRIL